MQMTFDQLLDAVESLPHQQRLDLADIIRKRAWLDRRSEMIQQAQETSAAYRRGELETTSVEAFLREINAEG
jgi:hypothetical protein